ncbi:hypothetical protein D2Q93_14435, partial [Alicyclobacillaceae bacterium I2511]
QPHKTHLRIGNLVALDSSNFTIFEPGCVLLFTQLRGLSGQPLKYILRVSELSGDGRMEQKAFPRIEA